MNKIERDKFTTKLRTLLEESIQNNTPPTDAQIKTLTQEPFLQTHAGRLALHLVIGRQHSCLHPPSPPQEAIDRIQAIIDQSADNRGIIPRRLTVNPPCGYATAVEALLIGSHLAR